MSAEISPLLEAVASGGAIVLIAWLVRHTFTHTIPRLAQSFDKNLDKLAERFEKMTSTQHDQFFRHLEAQRQQFLGAMEEAKTQQRDDYGLIIEALHEVRDRLDHLEERSK